MRSQLLLLGLLGLAACAVPATNEEGFASSAINDNEEEVPSLGGGGIFENNGLAPTAASDYLMGNEWGKKAVTAASLGTATGPFQRAAKATARVGGATGFYLGKFAGVHVVATNHHVQSSMSCGGRSAKFPLLDNLSLPCAKVLGTWNSIDLALFTVTVRPETEEKLAAIAGNFVFDADIQKGQQLITVGFGVANNPQRVMMGNQDSDCRVMSKTAEYRLMADPDELNPGSYKAWSFSHACDISHGDSGSAMVDRATGLPIGIVWTGRIPKQARVQDSAYLEQVFQTDHDDVWKEMNYGVPASKMKEHISTVIANPSTPADTRTILQAVIAPPAPPPPTR